MFEQRPWIGAPSPVLEQMLPIGDAMTTHVEIRVADHAVEIDLPRISDVLGERIGVALADEIRAASDVAAIYVPSARERYWARIQAPVRVRLVHRLVVLWPMVFMVGAAGVALTLREDENLIESLVLLIFPLTLAGAVVLSREATSLAERLLRPWRVALVVLIAVIWLLTLGRVLLKADVWWAESACEYVGDLAGLLTTRLC